MPGAEEMVLDIYRNRSKSGKLNNQLGKEDVARSQVLVDLRFACWAYLEQAAPCILSLECFHVLSSV